MCFEQALIHVARMTRGVTQAFQGGQFGQPAQQIAKAERPAGGIEAVPGVDVLAEQRQLHDAGIHEVFRLAENIGERARDLSAARIGNDAERAELVAAFLHGEEGGEAAGFGGGARRQRQAGEFAGNVEIGRDAAVRDGQRRGIAGRKACGRAAARCTSSGK